MEKPFNFGDNLRKIRESKNYSQEAVGNAIGVSQPTYNRIENNRRKVALPMRQKISEFLEVPLSALQAPAQTGAAPSPPPPPPETNSSDGWTSSNKILRRLLVISLVLGGSIVFGNILNSMLSAEDMDLGFFRGTSPNDDGFNLSWQQAVIIVLITLSLVTLTGWGIWRGLKKLWG